MRTFTGYRPQVPEHYIEGGYGNAGDEPQYQGIEFDDGTVVVRWLTQFRSTSVWRALAVFEAVHGHPDYGTRIAWDAATPPTPVPASLFPADDTVYALYTECCQFLRKGSDWPDGSMHSSWPHTHQPVLRLVAAPTPPTPERLESEHRCSSACADDPNCPVIAAYNAGERLEALERVAVAAEPLAGCYAPVVDEDAERIIGECGFCAGCKLLAALTSLSAPTEKETTND